MLYVFNTSQVVELHGIFPLAANCQLYRQYYTCQEPYSYDKLRVETVRLWRIDICGHRGSNSLVSSV